MEDTKQDVAVEICAYKKNQVVKIGEKLYMLNTSTSIIGEFGAAVF